MARRIRKTSWTRSWKSQLDAMTRLALRAGKTAMKQARAVTPKANAKAKTRLRIATRVPPPTQRAATAGGRWTSGIALRATGARRYRLYRPAGLRRDDRVPLVVMLHGCDQDAAALAAVSRMNRVAERERCIVLYPEQDRLHNAHGCWNWFETRSGKAQQELDIIRAAIEQACLQQPIDRDRIAVAGLSAGAGMAALLALRHPTLVRAVAMHSGVAPGLAQSSSSALAAMRGSRRAAPYARSAEPLPALLVIHGLQDPVVAADNARNAATLWADAAGAVAGAARTVQRGARHAMQLVDYRDPAGRTVVRLCEIERLGHAWSGGAPGHRYSDPRGPDAARLIWSFFRTAFAAVRRDSQSVAKQ